MKKRLLIIVLCLILSAGAAFAGCKKPKEDDWDPENPESPRVNITFWGYGEEIANETYWGIINDFNSNNPYNIKVSYMQYPQADFDSSLEVALSGTYAPDAFLVGDKALRRLSKMNLLEPLDDYISNPDYNKSINVGDFYEKAMARFTYDTKTSTQNGPDAKLYAFPKDVSPTILYYNADKLKAAGVKIVSVDKEDVGQFNDGQPDAAGNTKASLGIGNITAVGWNQATRVFNNRIAMTWNEAEQFGQFFTRNSKSPNPNASSPTEFGYFTAWWFNYGWSVGGDCMQYDAANKKYEFTLGDTAPNWIVKEGETVTANGNTYNAGEIIGFYDRDAADKAKCTQLPSQFDAFERFTKLSQPKEKGGLSISPPPDTISTGGAYAYFMAQNVAAFIDGRFLVPDLRRSARFDWDVAPLPKHPDGIEAGHSDMVGVGIWKESKKKLAAFKFLEWFVAEKAQRAVASAGFSLSTMREVGKSQDFLNPGGQNLKPRNAVVFARAAEHQREADWAYLTDGAWIQEWAPTLNGPVRNGTMDLATFFAQVTNKTNKVLEAYTK